MGLRVTTLLVLLLGLCALPTPSVASLPVLCDVAAPHCHEGIVGNGVCDKACNVAACEFDKGDCMDGMEHREVIQEPTPLRLEELAETNGDADNTTVTGLSPEIKYYRPNYGCEICMNTVLRKLHRGADKVTEELCKGFSVEADGIMCSKVLEAFNAYDRYLVDWLYGVGCEWNDKGLWRPVQPCPPHIVCSWMYRPLGHGVANTRPFCEFTDADYRRPQEFYDKHHIQEQANV